MDRAQMAVPPPQAGVLTPEYAFPVQTWSDREKQRSEASVSPSWPREEFRFFMECEEPVQAPGAWSGGWMSRCSPRVRATLSSGTRSARRGRREQEFDSRGGSDLAWSPTRPAQRAGRA